MASRYTDEFRDLDKAGYSVILTRTREPTRAIEALKLYTFTRKNKEGALASKFRVWDCVGGWVESPFELKYISGGSTELKELEPKPIGDSDNEPVTDIVAAWNMIEDSPHQGKDRWTDGIYVLYYPHFFLDAQKSDDCSELVTVIKRSCHTLPSTKCRVVLVVPEGFQMPGELEDDIRILDFAVPTHEELSARFLELMEDMEKTNPYPPEDVAAIASAGMGMTLLDFDQSVALALTRLIQDGGALITPIEAFLAVIYGCKTEAVKRTSMLELVEPIPVNTVAGMTAVKSYLEDCKDDLTSDALAFGLVPAKGMLMVGLGGTGKSLGPKMSGTILKLPIIRWDMTKVFGKYVGESEAKMSGGLSFIDSIKPCIVWVDELDKMGFGGSGHETSQHVLGQLLTSMQEGGPGRFWIFTANDPHKIPSWLIRAGRVDITFGVVLPGALERKSAFIIHLIKRKQRFNFDLTPAIKASKGFTPAEIESAVNSAVRNCLRNGKDAMSADYLVNALARMKPQSESHKTEFDQLISWCNENAVPASTEEDRAELDDTPKKGGPPRAPAPLPPQKPIVKPVPTTFIKLRKPAPRI